jgi:drug/metabolite transporter (DMT)-like permease
MSNHRASLLAYAAVAFICLSWGTTYLVLRIGVQEIPPFLFSGLRQVLAGGVMVLAARYVFKIPFPPKTQFPAVLASGILMITGGNGLVAWAELYVTSGVAALICSIMPVWAVVINLITRTEEKINGTILFGMALGVVGILVVFREHLSDFANPKYTLGIVFTIIATLTWAYGSVVSKFKTPGNHPVMLGGLHLFLGGASMLFISPLADDYSNISFSKEGMYALLYLMIVGSVLSMSAYLYALQRLPVALVSVYSYVNPIVAVFLGWLILDEPLNEMIGLAAFLIVGGIWLVNRGYSKARLG